MRSMRPPDVLVLSWRKRGVQPPDMGRAWRGVQVMRVVRVLRWGVPGRIVRCVLCCGGRFRCVSPRFCFPRHSVVRACRSHCSTVVCVAPCRPTAAAMLLLTSPVSEQTPKRTATPRWRVTVTLLLMLAPPWHGGWTGGLSPPCSAPTSAATYLYQHPRRQVGRGTLTAPSARRREQIACRGPWDWPTVPQNLSAYQACTPPEPPRRARPRVGGGVCRECSDRPPPSDDHPWPNGFRRKVPQSPKKPQKSGTKGH